MNDSQFHREADKLAAMLELNIIRGRTFLDQLPEFEDRNPRTRKRTRAVIKHGQ